MLQCVAVCCRERNASVLTPVFVSSSPFRSFFLFDVTVFRMCDVVPGVLVALQCVEVCCSVLQCVAVCCSVLQCVMSGVSAVL